MERCIYCNNQYKNVLQHLRKSTYCGKRHHSTQSVMYNDDDTINGNNCNVSFHSTNQNIEEEDMESFPTLNNVDLSTTDDHTTDREGVYFPPGTTHDPNPAYSQDDFTFTNQMSGYLKLINFLDIHNMPKYAFDHLMGLLSLIYTDGFKFDDVHPSRKTILKKVGKQFNIPQYKRIPVDLEVDEDNNNKTVHVYQFDIVAQIRNLLSESIFYSPENLVVNPENPFGKYVSPDNRYDEVNSGDWYNRTYNKRISDPDNETLLCMKIYCDKTGCDPMLQRHGLEPIMFTFTIFKRSIQQQCTKAWRHIGFIPDLDQRAKSETQHSSSSDKRRGRSTRNYHKCLAAILDPLYKIQETGLSVYLRIGDHVKQMHAYFPVALIIGDAKSNDMWCCRVPHYDQARMSRACYTPYEECCNPRHICQLVLQEDQRVLSERCKLYEDEEEDPDLIEDLKATSTVRCHSSLFMMDFGDNAHGQFGCCTADPMHLFEGGWCANVAKAFVGSLYAKNRYNLDTLLENIRISSRSSCRSRFPRINFSGGVTNMKHIASHEWPGVILAYLVAVQTVKGKEILANRLDDDDEIYKRRLKKESQKRKTQAKRQRLLREHDLLNRSEKFAIQRARRHGEEINEDSDSNDETNNEEEDYVPTHRCTFENIVELFEMLLCFHAFYKKSRYWPIGDNNSCSTFDSSLRKMMQHLTNTLSRGDNTNNWNTQKTHELLHFPKQIVEYGSLLNFDTGVGERGLKYWAKKPGRSALKGCIDVFTESTAKHLQESILVQTAVEAMERKSGYTGHIMDNSTAGPANDFAGNEKYRVELHADSDGKLAVLYKWISGTKYKQDFVVDPKIINLFSEEYSEKINATGDHHQLTIRCFTEMITATGSTVRAHPNFRAAGAIYDWVVVKDPNGGFDHATKHRKEIPPEYVRNSTFSRIEKENPGCVPARVLSFFVDPITHQKKAIVHPCRPWMNINEHKSSVLTESWNLQCTLERFYVDDDGTYTLVYMRGQRAKLRYAPMYHIVDIHQIIDAVFAISEEDALEISWKPSGGNVLVICDRDKYWGNEFLEFA